MPPRGDPRSMSLGTSVAGAGAVPRDARLRVVAARVTRAAVLVVGRLPIMPAGNPAQSPQPTGGAIVDGTYVLTQIVVYRAPTGPTGGQPQGGILRFSPGNIEGKVDMGDGDPLAVSVDQRQ